MKDWLFKLAKSVGELLTSKKVLTAVATALSAWAAGDQSTKAILVGLGIALLLGQGAADFGKSAKATPPAQPSPPAPPPPANKTEPTP